MRVNKLFALSGGSGDAEFFASRGSIKLDYPRSYDGYSFYYVSGDVVIDATNANKNYTSKLLHKDIFPPVFTTTAGTIKIIEDVNGTERTYVPTDPLPEYVEGVLNTIYFVRDNSGGAVSEIKILIVN